MKKFLSMLTILVLMLCAGCGEKNVYQSLTQDEAIQMIAEDPDVIVLDVRTPEEYGHKHIPNAKLVPIEEFQKGNFSALPDKNATILIYCWTGRRAQDSAQILADNGYTNVYEFGGIVDWKGDVE